MLRVGLAKLVLLVVVASSDADDARDDYRRVVLERSERIVETLGLDDPTQASRVMEIIADQYVDLSSVHDQRDSVQAGQEPGSTSGQDASLRRLTELHRRFVARLTADLAPEQVDAVKDGMTYRVVPITYSAYQRLLPDLNEDQKRMILANLLEAREYAMDAGSSKEKHAWFGKYKGRINNRLSEAGYDLKQAERDLAASDPR